MINFRYHLVSLIGVFLALAVGVVLGAGPLQNAINNVGADQVTGASAAELEEELAAASSEGQAGQDLAALGREGGQGLHVLVVNEGGFLDAELAELGASSSKGLLLLGLSLCISLALHPITSSGLRSLTPA